jgi:hypothetical protein
VDEAFVKITKYLAHLAMTYRSIRRLKPITIVRGQVGGMIILSDPF